MRTANITYEPSFEGLPIQAYPSMDMGCHGEILERGRDILNYMILKHCRVLFIRFDLRFPITMACPTDNTAIQRFIDSFTVNLGRGGYDPRYLWVRERSGDGRCHYHVALWLDGTKTYSAFYHFDIAESLWASALGIDDAKYLVERCQAIARDNSRKSALMIVRGAPNFEETRNHCFYWFSYLAKTATKDAPFGVRSFGCSALR